MDFEAMLVSRNTYVTWACFMARCASFVVCGKNTSEIVSLVQPYITSDDFEPSKPSSAQPTLLDFALFSGELLLQDIETIALQLYYSSFFISLTEYEVYYCRVLCCTAANGVFYGSFKKCSEAALL